MNPMETLEKIVTDIVAPSALDTDRESRFPRAAIKALGESGLLGLISAKEVGGLGGGLAEASAVIRRIAQDCPSTAMVVCMHYCATSLIEKHGSEAVRRDIAAGRHLSTLAFSEAGSRSHFWAPMSSATADGDEVVLDAAKSWITSAGEADSYVWSSRPTTGERPCSLWLVPAATAGLEFSGGFDGLGLRGNASLPVRANGARIPRSALLGEDGRGSDLMNAVLPWFASLNASSSVGLMNGALARACAHVGATRYAHLGSSLADLPTIRAYLAKARIRTDQAATLLDDTIAALAAGREDAVLRVFQTKAASAEAALYVTDTAMRVCGGAAFRKEAGVERLFRDARAASVMGPTSDVLYDFIGKIMLGLPIF
ncbi:acyl-CoA dehydrogenase [Azoarcus indigens]|uniref:Alkylation response protein AidB-like acyl-CoA dehydrogenase n=1 Tax=Azoarcus indigens TaxID=29545 RepID=A0A4R6DUB3_9RHOO|nr:acyl-CoA dehydrogenase family protein [Azoarcus indigens]NMG65294.1 acyl-CoA dehydrogenase [Azoarcus indigens]TDN47888.1 alkylation response protein AidB-like acyl-CoA dehydrogenase [Azoarcus indigens]